MLNIIATSLSQEVFKYGSARYFNKAEGNLKKTDLHKCLDPVSKLGHTKKRCCGPSKELLIDIIAFEKDAVADPKWTNCGHVARIDDM